MTIFLIFMAILAAVAPVCLALISLFNVCGLPRGDLYRHAWVRAHLAGMRGSLLDVGCGPQPYREDCRHLDYKAQDFASYTGQGAEGLHDSEWKYGALDFTGDAWRIATPDASFDNVLCTEVLEHVPYPRETLLEIVRILKPGGTALITAPINCIPHQSPYFFSHGLSKEFYLQSGEDVRFETYSGAVDFLTQETYRAMRSGVWALAPALLPLLLCRILGIKGPEYPCFGALVVLTKTKRGSKAINNPGKNGLYPDGSINRPGATKKWRPE